MVKAHMCKVVNAMIALSKKSPLSVCYREGFPSAAVIHLTVEKRGESVSAATPAEPRGEKILFFMCKFWAVKNF